MTLEPFGIALKMACGKVLNFPIQKGINLQMILTRKALQQGDVAKSTKLNKSSLEVVIDLRTFYLSLPRQSSSTLITKQLFICLHLLPFQAK